MAMRALVALTLIGLVYACVPSNTNAQTSEPAAEARDPEQVEAERRFPRAPGQSDAYYTAKIVAALQFKATPDGRFGDPDLEDRFRVFSEEPSIWGCSEEFGAVWDSEVSIGDDTEQSIEPARKRELALQDIAYRAVALRLMLARKGIAESRTAPAIAEWEAARLADFAAGRESAMQTYRGDLFGTGTIEEAEMAPEDYALMVRLNRTAKAGLTPADGCGAGEFTYVLETRPAGTPAAIIRQFDFDLCRVTGIEPGDRVRCRGWRNVVGGQPYLLSGNYRYVIETPGKQTSGSFAAQRTERAQEEGETIVIGNGGAK